MTKLCKCPNCNCRFKNIGNMSKHRWKEHPNIVKASIKRGMNNSTKTPKAKLEKSVKALRDVAGLIAALTPAIVTRNPVLALGAADDIKRVLDDVADLIK